MASSKKQRANDTSELGAIVLAGLMALGSAALLPYAIAIVIALRLLQWRRTGHISQPTSIDPAIIFLLLLMPLTQWISIKPDVTWVQVLRLVFGIGWFYALFNWANLPKQLNQIMIGFVLFGLVFAFTGPFIVNYRGGKLPFLPDTLYEWFVPVFSHSINANVFAGVVALIAPLAFAQIVFGNQRPTCIFFALAFAVMSIMLLISQSRGGLMAFAASNASVLILHTTHKSKLWRVIVGLGIIAILFMVGWISPAALTNTLLNNSSLGGLDARLEIWTRAIYIIQDFAFTGIGMGTFEPVSLALYSTYISKFDIPHAHNLFLQVAVDLGLPGFIAWVIIFGSTGRAVLQVFIQQTRCPTPNTPLTALAAGLLGSQIALATHGLTDAVMWGVVRSAPLVWLMWAMCLSLKKINANTT